MAEKKPKSVRDRTLEVQKRNARTAAQNHIKNTGESPDQEGMNLLQMQVELRMLGKKTKGNPTDADADIDFAYRNMALTTVTPLMAPSTTAFEWYLFARNDRDEFLKICAKREDAKAKMAGTITNQRMADDRRSQFEVIDRIEKALTLDVAAIVNELLEKFPDDVLKVVKLFEAKSGGKSPQ